MRRDPGTVLDEWLVASAKTGGEVAFGQLVGRWTPRLLRHASRLLGDIDQAQDVVQDAWVGAARGLRRLEDPARFPAWMFALVSRRCTDRVRRNVRDRRLAAQVADLRGPPAEADGADQRLDLRHAIAELPVDQPALRRGLRHRRDRRRPRPSLGHGEVAPVRGPPDPQGLPARRRP
jgi:RNA polymerase sigma-70 factor (ECF subfamily)